MSIIFCQILGPLVLGWAPNHFVLGAQLAPGEKMLVCIPENVVCLRHLLQVFAHIIDKCKYTLKPVLSGHSKIDKTRVLMANGSLVMVKSIAKCSNGSILQYF